MPLWGPGPHGPQGEVNTVPTSNGRSLVATWQKPWEFDQVFMVDKSGRNYITIKSAVTAANLVATTSNRVAIIVWPGSYTEQNPINPGGYISIFAIGRHEVTRMLCANTNQDGLVLHDAPDCEVVGLQVRGASDAGFAAFRISGTSEDIDLHDCKPFDSSIGFRIDSTGSALVIRECNGKGSTLGTLIKAEAGAAVSVNDAQVTGDTTLTNFVLADGAGAIVRINSSILNGALTANGMHADNGGLIETNSARLSDMTNGMRVGSGGGTIRGSGNDINGSLTWALLSESASALFELSGGRFNEELISRTAGDTVRSSAFSSRAGDEGLAVLGELHVGYFTAPAECALGGGDSHTIGMIVQTNTNLAAGAWVDETEDAASPSGSTWTLFPGVGANNACYFGGDEQFPGLKFSITATPITLGAGSLTWQFWNGAAWEAFNVVACDANGPHQQYALDTFQRANQSDQVRFDDISGTWAKSTLNGENKYWVRVIIATAITAAPVLEQSKLHTSRFEVNADGVTEKFGGAIQEKTIEMGELRALAGGGTPGNVSVAVSTNITYTGNRNEYKAGDGVAFKFAVPVGLDTSKPLTLTTVWKPNSTNTGNVSLDVYVVEGRVGDIVAGALAETTVNVIQAAGGVTDAIEPLTEHSFSVPDVVPGEVLFIGHKRISTGDTFTGRTEIIKRELRGYFWRD